MNRRSQCSLAVGRTAGWLLHRLVPAVLGMAAALPAAAQLNQTQHTDGWIIAAAHAPGKNGSIWRTDLWVVMENVNAGTRFQLTFCRSGEDNSGVLPVSVSLTPGTNIYYLEDVIDQYLSVGGGSWVGAIHYTSTRSVQVWARVYSINADGTKSYGQLVEGIPTADMSPDNDPWDSNVHQWMFAVKHTSDNRYRVNVGVVNPTDVASHYFIDMWDATYSQHSDVELDVPPYSMVQLLDPFADYLGGDWSAVQIRVVCTTEGGGTFAYASVIDNATNDAFFVRGVKSLPPDR